MSRYKSTLRLATSTTGIERHIETLIVKRKNKNNNISFLHEIKLHLQMDSLFLSVRWKTPPTEFSDVY